MKEIFISLKIKMAIIVIIVIIVCFLTGLAAIGYAAYDAATEKTVEEVFRRADKAMYDRKVAMKAERKD